VENLLFSIAWGCAAFFVYLRTSKGATRKLAGLLRWKQWKKDRAIWIGGSGSVEGILMKLGRIEEDCRVFEER
jgi:hypothetical protein